jgi:putative Ig domain-containing protein
MRVRFVQLLLLLTVVSAAFAGVAKALDFDDEDPHPPHPEIGLLYHYEIGTHAGCIPHHVVISSGQLPPGLKLTQIGYQTALVDGIATEAGTFSVWLAVKDCENRSAETLFTFEVWARRFSVATQALKAAPLGSPYSATLETSGIPSNTTWELAGGTLPAGLTLSKEGLISGTPTAVGSSTFSVKATGVAKDFTGTRVDTKQLTLNVVAFAARSARPQAEVGVPFRSTLVGSGGQAPYTWTATGVPAGLAVAPDGTISGTPTRAGSYSFTAGINDATGAAATVQVKLAVRARLAITSRSLRTAARGHGYVAKIGFRGGVTGVRWTLAAGKLPSGLKLASRTGTISGAPRAAGTFRFTIRARDSLGAVATKKLVLTVR